LGLSIFGKMWTSWNAWARDVEIAPAIRRVFYRSRKRLSWLRAKSVQLAHPNLSANFVPSVVTAVETASMIVPSSGLEMDNFQLAPVNNWAKIKGQWSSSATETLRFIFMWSNPNDRDTVINAASYLAVNGSCHLDANSGFLGIFPVARAAWL
jgi:hypothetical protein